MVDDEDRVLVMWRHRFIVDKWVWELPGGYVDHAEDPAASAAREVEEETGWRPVDKPEFVLTFQPMIGNADSPQDASQPELPGLTAAGWSSSANGASRCTPIRLPPS